jgi:hypothetical protein
MTIYYLMIAGAGLRFRPGLVWFVCIACILSYATLLLDVFVLQLLPRPPLPIYNVVIGLLTLPLMGLTVALLLRRFRLALGDEQ